MNAELIKVDKNGSKHYHGLVKCDRCGGEGESEQWKFTGYTCFKCGGAGVVETTWIERTPEYQAKLDARRAARNAKRMAEIKAARSEEEAKRKAEETAEEARKEAERIERAKSQYVGAEGKKITIEATYEFTAWFDYKDPFGREERMYIHNFKDVAGNALVWKTGTFNFDAEKGDKIILKGTIKEHAEYRGQKQTKLIRCKITKAE